MNHYFYDFQVYQSSSIQIPEEALKGKNEKGLLLVAKEEDFSAENLQFLTKIIAAVKYELEIDTLRLNIPKDQNYGINELLKQEQTKHIIVFGVNPKDLGLSIETIIYQPISINKKTILITHPLEKIKQSQELKKALWASLQQIFL